MKRRGSIRGKTRVASEKNEVSIRGAEKWRKSRVRLRERNMVDNQWFKIPESNDIMFLIDMENMKHSICKM